MAVEKITQFVKVGFTDTERLAIALECAREDRDPSAYIRLVLRRHLFGVSDRTAIVKAAGEESEWMNSAPAAL